MRFLQYITKNNGLLRLGIQEGQNVLDLPSCDRLIPNNLLDFLKGGENMMKETTRALAMKTGDVYKMEDIIIKAPIVAPDKVVCVGMNYRDHCEELNVPVPEEPVIFNKFPSSIAGPNDPIPLPSLTEALDYEVELAVIIGKKGKEIPLERAMDHVFGYCVAHDVTARDWVDQGKNGGQWLLGKTMDAFCPLGPCIVTRDEIPDPHSLSIRCSINGKLKQDGNTNKMVHRIDAVVSRLSRFCTLLPGDVILTGTPPGVGCFKKPPEYLKVGDVVVCEIEGIGRIQNKIV